MANAAAIRRKMAKAARKHGGAATLVRVIPGTLDEQTDNTTPPATLKYPCFALWQPYAALSGLGFGESFQAGSNRVVRGETCFISPDDFPAGVDPTPGDTLVVTSSGRERTITSVKGLRLDGETPLYYEVIVTP